MARVGIGADEAQRTYEADVDVVPASSTRPTTAWRECLDNVIVVDDRHAERILREYIRYYHGRPYRGLHMQAPLGAHWLPPMRPTPASSVRSVPILGGLHREYTVAV